MVNFISLKSSRNQISGKVSTFYLIELIHQSRRRHRFTSRPRMRCDRVGAYAEISENMNGSFVRMKPVDFRLSGTAVPKA